MPTTQPSCPNSSPPPPNCEASDTAAPSSFVSAASREWPAGFKLTIVIPVFNEQQTIGEILRRVRAVPVPKEIIVVDDRSADETRAVLEQLADWPELHVIYKPRNEGKGAALRTGFAAATGDVVVVQDADLEYDPNDLPSLLEPILSGEADVVYGSRYLHEMPQDPSVLHRLGNQLLTWASNLFTGLRLTDMETCYKMIPRPLLQSLEIQQNRFGFEPEVTAKLARRGGESRNCRSVTRVAATRRERRSAGATASMPSTASFATVGETEPRKIRPEPVVRST